MPPKTFQEFIVAACDGRAVEVLAYLRENPDDVDKVDPDLNVSAAHCAAQLGHGNVLKTLKEFGANFSVKDPILDRTPLHDAAETGKAEVVRFLLNENVDPFLCDAARFNVLHIAVANRNVNFVRALRDALPAERWEKLLLMPTMVSARGERRVALELAETNQAMLELLKPKETKVKHLRLDVDVTITNSLGRNILHEAVANCDLKMVKRLREKLSIEVWNALLEQKSGSIDKQATPIELAPRLEQFPELVGLLVKKIPLGLRRSNSESYLGYTHQRLFQYRIKPSQQIGRNFVDKAEHRTQLMVLARRGDCKMVRQSFGDSCNLAYGINAQTKTLGISALLIAVDFQKPEMVSLLLKLGADPLLCDKAGYNALHVALLGGNSVVVRALKEGVSAEKWEELLRSVPALLERRVELRELLPTPSSGLRPGP